MRRIDDAHADVIFDLTAIKLFIAPRAATTR
jgi:hypothetical protein